MSPKRLLLESKITNPSNSTYKTQSELNHVETNEIKCKPNILSNEKLSTKDNIENAYSQLIEIMCPFIHTTNIFFTAKKQFFHENSKIIQENFAD